MGSLPAVAPHPGKNRKLFRARQRIVASNGNGTCRGVRSVQRKTVGTDTVYGRHVRRKFRPPGQPQVPPIPIPPRIDGPSRHLLLWLENPLPRHLPVPCACPPSHPRPQANSRRHPPKNSPCLGVHARPFARVFFGHRTLLPMSKPMPENLVPILPENPKTSRNNYRRLLSVLSLLPRPPSFRFSRFSRFLRFSRPPRSPLSRPLFPFTNRLPPPAAARCPACPQTRHAAGTTDSRPRRSP